MEKESICSCSINYFFSPYNFFLYRQCIEMKKRLDMIFEALNRTGIDFQCTEEKRCDNKQLDSSSFLPVSTTTNHQDPTTWAATISKLPLAVTNHLPSCLLAESSATFLADKPRAIVAPSEVPRSIFDIEETVPKVRLADLVTPQVVEVDAEKTSVWANGSREGGTFVINPGVKRVIDFR